jgi:DNA-binding CsgD family transcriptional regulator
LAVSVTVCAGSPVPFDAAEIDKKLAAARTLNTLAAVANNAVFDLYDHCALVVRFLVIGSNGEASVVDVRGHRTLAEGRLAHRARAIGSGVVQVVKVGRPAGFDLVAAPLHDGERVVGVLEAVVPSEMVAPKRDRLAIVVRATSSSLRAWHKATLAQLEASHAAGTSFALGLRLAGALMQAGELGVATRDAVQLLARELKTPVVAWRTDPSDQALRIGPSSGLSSNHRSSLESAAASVSLVGDRALTLRDLRLRISAVFGSEATLADGGPVVFVAGGNQPELERCGRDLAGLLGRLPVSRVATLDHGEEHCAPKALEEIELARLRDLTPRESEILGLLAGGAGTRQIASRLVISQKTVKTHVQNLLRKLGAASRLEAAAMAVRAGFVPLSASKVGHPGYEILLME